MLAFMRKRAAMICGALVGVCAALWFWPSPAPDRSKVHPALLELVPPFSTFHTNFYWDGGSISVRLVDSRGQTRKFALPVDPPDFSYPRLFVGAEHVSEPGAVEIPFNIDTRRMLISWIEEHQGPGDSSDVALLRLRGSFKDHASGLIRATILWGEEFFQ